MESLVCKSCGSTNFVKTGSMYTCVYCGAQQVSEAEMNREEKIEHYFNLHLRYDTEHDFPKALEYIDKVLDLDMYNIEANIFRFKSKYKTAPLQYTCKDYEVYVKKCIIPYVFEQNLDTDCRCEAVTMFTVVSLSMLDLFHKRAIREVKCNPSSLRAFSELVDSYYHIYCCVYNANVFNDKIMPCIEDQLHEMLEKVAMIYANVILSYRDKDAHINIFNKRFLCRIKLSKPDYTSPPFRSFKESYL